MATSGVLGEGWLRVGNWALRDGESLPLVILQILVYFGARNPEKKELPILRYCSHSFIHWVIHSSNIRCSPLCVGQAQCFLQEVYIGFLGNPGWGCDHFCGMEVKRLNLSLMSSLEQVTSHHRDSRFSPEDPCSSDALCCCTFKLGGLAFLFLLLLAKTEVRPDGASSHSPFRLIFKILPLPYPPSLGRGGTDEKRKRVTERKTKCKKLSRLPVVSENYQVSTWTKRCHCAPWLLPDFGAQMGVLCQVRDCGSEWRPTYIHIPMATLR